MFKLYLCTCNANVYTGFVIFYYSNTSCQLITSELINHNFASLLHWKQNVFKYFHVARLCNLWNLINLKLIENGTFEADEKSWRDSIHFDETLQGFIAL